MHRNQTLLAEKLRHSRHTAVLTGAGVSAESGISTFRDPEGLWSKFKPEELANVEALLSNPERVQDWYAHRRPIILKAEPNPGHKALAELERHIDTVTVITQNVDGLHRRAGSTRIHRLHGSLENNYCIECQRPTDEEFPGSSSSRNTRGGGKPRRCTECGGLIRPDVVWFGEMLPMDVLQAARSAAQNCDVFLTVGTSALVSPAADLPLYAAESGAFTAEVNVERSAVADYLDVVILGKSGVVLPEILYLLDA